MTEPCRGKQSIEDLAIFGGRPLFDEPLHVGRPHIGSREALLGRINEILDRRWLTNDGPLVREFEARVAEFLGARHCIAMCNGTVALEIAIRGLGLTGEVIVPSFTFIATAHALAWQEITPVFCDVRPETHNLDPACVAALITPRTTGVIGVHVWGRACPIAELTKLCDDRGLALLFDASHAFGCTYRGKRLGTFGRAEVFSFHATKVLNSFEGGAVVTNDDELATRLRLMRNFGFAGYDDVAYLGTNGKMSEVSAAMGLTSLESLDEFISANRRHHDQYRSELAGVSGVRLLDYEHREEANYQYVVVEIDHRAARISRDRLVDLVWKENVLARRYFYPGCHGMRPYREKYPHVGALLPQTEALCARVMLLPTGTAMNAEDVSAVAGLLRFCVQQAQAIAARLGSIS